MSDAINKGGCLCGAVQYETSVPVGDVTACHCSQCRKQSGHYVASVYLDWSDVKLSNEDKITWHASSDFAKRGFCSVCGSNRFWVSPEFGAAICAGTLDKPTNSRLASHIFVKDKGDYYDIADGLPRHEGYPPEIDQPEVTGD